MMAERWGPHSLSVLYVERYQKGRLLHDETYTIGIKGRWSDYPVLQETMSLFKISVSLILVALSTHCAANELDGFGYSCKDTSLVNNVLYSSCEGTDGSYSSTSIDLNQCVVNTNGNLSCSAK